ncbi:hypothetical protein ACFWHQ_26680 [Streptomyces sp. NPDC060334]|uniref:hypothetical protein n=1 Tax=unclassified Streptomyces TaxID=2593676 RepID=UPI0033343252
MTGSSSRFYLRTYRIGPDGARYDESGLTAIRTDPDRTAVPATTAWPDCQCPQHSGSNTTTRTTTTHQEAHMPWGTGKGGSSGTGGGSGSNDGGNGKHSGGKDPGTSKPSPDTQNPPSGGKHKK